MLDRDRISCVATVELAWRWRRFLQVVGLTVGFLSAQIGGNLARLALGKTGYDAAVTLMLAHVRSLA